MATQGNLIHRRKTLPPPRTAETLPLLNSFRLNYRIYFGFMIHKLKLEQLCIN